MLPENHQSSPIRLLDWSTQHSENPAANRYAYSLFGQDKNGTNNSDQIPAYGILKNPLLERNSEINLNAFVEAQSKTIPFDFIAASSMSGGDHAMPDSNDFMKYIDLVDKDRRDMEKRLTDDRKESEQRIASYIEKLNDKIDKVSEKIDQQKDDNIKSNREHRAWSIATIIAIAGLVVAAFYGTAQIVVSILQK